MKYINIKGTDLKASNIALGCMRIAYMPAETREERINQVEELVKTALDLGINFFDHADIYGLGESEKLFGEVLKRNPQFREKMIIQSKCGIVPGKCYDFSQKHILECVDNSLQNLNTDYLDILLLHRPDVLMDPKEVADTFDILYTSGKVKYFGVSNMNPMQIELIKKYSKQPIVIDQVQFNLVNAGLVDCGINVNMTNHESINRDGSLLEYCQLNDITIQPWSILQASWEKGTFIDHPDYKELNDKLEEVGKKYGLDKAAMSVAWILRHPCHMQPIAGTTNPERLRNLVKASEVEISREDYYALYLANNRRLP